MSSIAASGKEVRVVEAARMKIKQRKMNHGTTSSSSSIPTYHFPDNVVDSIVSCFSSDEMISLLGHISQQFKNSTERVAETIWKQHQSYEKWRWNLFTINRGTLDDKPTLSKAVVLLNKWETQLKFLFHFTTLVDAARFFRNDHLGRTSKVSFPHEHKEKTMIHSGFGGLLQFMGGLSISKNKYVKSDATMMGFRSNNDDNICHRFIGKIYYRNSLTMIGDRDCFSIGLVNTKYEHFDEGYEEKKIPKELQKKNNDNSIFHKVDPMAESLGKECILGISVNMITNTFEIINPEQKFHALYSISSNHLLDSPAIHMAVIQTPKKYKKKRTRNGSMFQFGNHDIAIRECNDVNEWDRLFKKDDLSWTVSTIN